MQKAVSGYSVQSDDAVDLVNHNKLAEEYVLRVLDRLARNDRVDPRALALARTQLEQGFMWLNRAVFRPARIHGPLSLPDDGDAQRSPPDDGSTQS